MYVHNIYIYTISIHESLELDDAMGEDQAETRQGAQQKHFFPGLNNASETPKLNV